MKKVFQLLALLCIGLGAAQFSLAEVIWIDVRSVEEFTEDHIKGDINIPHEQITKQIGKKVTNKNAEIHLYCRSGRRADIAKAELSALGYNNVSNEGGIADVRQQRKICTSC